MTIPHSPIIHVENQWGLFLGSFSHNESHKHYFIQLSVSLGEKIRLMDHGGKVFVLENALIKSNVSHRFSCPSPHLTLLINPVSALGHYFTEAANGEDISGFCNGLTGEMNRISLDFLGGELTQAVFIGHIRSIMNEISCACTIHNQFNDERIKIAIDYLDKHADEIISLERIAEICCLSPSRFLHLFKEKTGISYRRMQLWNKINRSFKSLFAQSLSKTAHQYGFTDSAHYSKVFKETFGLSPKHLAKR